MPQWVRGAASPPWRPRRTPARRRGKGPAVTERAPARLSKTASLLLLSAALWLAPSGMGASAPMVVPDASGAGREVWLAAPATDFTESSTIGNGRLGAMIFGGIAEERIVLNESGMWSGSPQDADRPRAAAMLPEIRRLLVEGKNAQAEELVDAHFTCAGQGSGHGAGANLPYGSYQNLGNLRLGFAHDPADAEATDYRRELDLTEAVVRISYRQGGTRYTREAFVSAPEEVGALRLGAARPGRLSLGVRLDRPEGAKTMAVGSDGLQMDGQLNDGREGGTGVRFSARLRGIPKGGSVRVEGGVLRVRGADEALLLLAAATDIRTFAGRRIADAQRAAAADLARAATKSYAALRRDHVADYRRYFDRVGLRIGRAGEERAAAGWATPARLGGFSAGGGDPCRAAALFSFGHYLLY